MVASLPSTVGQSGPARRRGGSYPSGDAEHLSNNRRHWSVPLARDDTSQAAQPRHPGTGAALPSGHRRSFAVRVGSVPADRIRELRWLALRLDHDEPRPAVFPLPSRHEAVAEAGGLPQAAGLRGSARPRRYSMPSAAPAQAGSSRRRRAVPVSDSAVLLRPSTTVGTHAASPLPSFVASVSWPAR